MQNITLGLWRCMADGMGVESVGTGGRVLRSRKISGGSPPEMMIFLYLPTFFLDTY